MTRNTRQLELFPDLAAPAERTEEATEEAIPKARQECEVLKAPTELQHRQVAPAVAPAVTSVVAAAPSPPLRPSLRRRLEEALGEPLASLVTTDNRSRIVSARRSHVGLEVRIHQVFEKADEPTLSAVADVLLADRRSQRRRHALDRVRYHFENHRPEVTPRRETLRPVGRHFDLRVLRDRVNAEYFDGQIEVAVTWGNQRRVERRRRGGGYSLRLGSYDEQRRLVRLHPCLDRADIPEYVVESVVYHEMLHAAVPPQRRGGRRYVHTREFRRREQLYRHFDAANHWLEANLERLAGLR